VRSESLEKESLKKLVSLGAKCVAGDLSDKKSLEEILKNIDAVVCVHKGNTVHQNIIDASKKYNSVKLIFGALWTAFNPELSKPGENPIADVHRVTVDILKKGEIPYKGVFNGAFSEYAFLSDFLGLNFKSGKIRIAGDGNKKFWTTSTSDIAKLTPYILNDESKINCFVPIAGDYLSANEAVEIFERVSGKSFEKEIIDENQLNELIKKAQGYEGVSLKAQRSAFFSDAGFIDPVNAKDYPEVKLQNVEEFAKNFYQK
jgi:uncharacterized protein YbjT (DUF2867 family)